MQFWGIQFYQCDEKDHIKWIRWLSEIHPSKEEALKRGKELGGDFCVLEFRCIQTIDGNSGRVM